LVSYQEIKKLNVGNTHLIIKALPSGDSVGGTIWYFEYNKIVFLYALDIFHFENQLC
jgi:Cft2 family RNA processing exonuclease